MKYTKKDAIKASQKFIKEVSILEKKYGLTLNSDTGDIYLSFKTIDDSKHWDTVDLYWEGDGTGIKVEEEKSVVCPTCNSLREWRKND